MDTKEILVALGRIALALERQAEASEATNERLNEVVANLELVLDRVLEKQLPAEEATESRTRCSNCDGHGRIAGVPGRSMACPICRGAGR